MPADPSDSLPAGSGAYYLARLSRPAHRPLTTAALLFHRELQRSVTRCTDPGATRLKLDWWREELATAQASRHPLGRQLAPLATEPSGQTALQAMIDAAEADVCHQQPLDQAGFVAHCDNAGRLADLLCLAADTPCDARALGRYAAAVSRIRQLGRHLQRGHNPLPADLPLSTDPAGWSPTALAGLCAQLLAPLREDAERVLADRATRTRAARRWAALALARHRLLAREGFPVRDQLLDITPIARLWTTWRVR